VTESNYQRVVARVVRAGPCTAHVVTDVFASGQITIAVPTLDLMDATGLARRELAGAALMATADVSATVDTDVAPHGWQLIATADGRLAAPRSALATRAA
jgi:hypothetical protein